MSAMKAVVRFNGGLFCYPEFDEFCEQIRAKTASGGFLVVSPPIKRGITWPNWLANENVDATIHDS